MGVRNRISWALTRFKRRVYLRNIDTIPAIKRRNSDFARLREDICRSGTASKAHLGYSYTHEGGLTLQQHPDEFASLCLYLKEHGPHANYMEIGSASGGACLILWREVGFNNVISLDDGEHPLASEQSQNLGQIPNIKQFIGDSHSESAERFLANNLDGKLDVAFIDGDHSYEGVWQDVRLTLPFSRAGTLIAFHDTVVCAGVERAWLECAREKIIKPLAEYVGDDNPLGIGIGEVI